MISNVGYYTGTYRTVFIYVFNCFSKFRKDWTFGDLNKVFKLRFEKETCASCRVEQCSVRCVERPTGKNRRCAPTSPAHIPPTPPSPAPSAPPPFSPTTVLPNIRAHSMSCLLVPTCCCLASNPTCWQAPNPTCCLAPNPTCCRASNPTWRWLAPNPTCWWLAPNPTCWLAPNPTWWRASTAAAGSPRWGWTRI